MGGQARCTGRELVCPSLERTRGGRGGVSESVNGVDEAVVTCRGYVIIILSLKYVYSADVSKV